MYKTGVQQGLSSEPERKTYMIRNKRERVGGETNLVHCPAILYPQVEGEAFYWKEGVVIFQEKWTEQERRW